jgi:alcohol dehydrogenase class IV
MRTTWTFHSAGRLLFGRDASKQLGDILSGFKASRVFLVTDKRLVQAGLVDRLCGPLKQSGVTVAVFDGGEPEPAIRLAVECAEQARTFGPQALVALGGGSNMDLAKTAALLLTHGGKPQDYLGEEKIPGPVLPLVCVPTTAGTGSEVSGSAILTDTENHMKVGILSNYLRPAAAVVDPLFTVSCPPQVTADSGIDALVHAIEAYTAVDNEIFPLPAGEKTTYQGRNPMANMVAEQAITLIGSHLRRACRNGQDLDARDAMALGAMLGGLAFSNAGVALVHAMEYPVGGAVHCSHGCGNGLLVPYVMRYNLPGREKQFARIAQLLGEDISGLSDSAAAERAIAAVDQLRADVNIPARLRDLGVTREQLPQLATKAFAVKRVLRVNPRVPTEADILKIFEEAW